MNTKKVLHIVLFLSLIIGSLVFSKVVANADTSSQIAQNTSVNDNYYNNNTNVGVSDSGEYASTASSSPEGVGGFISENSRTMTIAAFIIVFMILALLV